MFKQPEYFQYLCDEDQKEYKELQNNLEKFSKRSQRNKKTDDFEIILDQVKKYCVRRDENDKVRSIVCGICFLKIGLGINVKQFQLLVNKCKSSINTTLRKMGYGIYQLRGDASDELFDFMPDFGKDVRELRNWSIRRKGSHFDRVKAAKIALKSIKQNPSKPLIYNNDIIDDNAVSNEESKEEHANFVIPSIIKPKDQCSLDEEYQNINSFLNPMVKMFLGGRK